MSPRPWERRISGELLRAIQAGRRRRRFENAAGWALGLLLLGLLLVECYAALRTW